MRRTDCGASGSDTLTETFAPIHRRMDATDWAIIACLSVLWGSSFFFLAVQLRVLPPATVVMLRVGLAAALLLGWAAATGLRLPGPRLWPAFVALALLNNVVPYLLYSFAQRTIASGLAGILNATTPLWGVLVAHLFTRDERATHAKVCGVLLGFSGVATMFGGRVLEGFGENALAEAACLLATLCYASAAIWSRRFSAAGVQPLAVSTMQLSVSAAIITPFAMMVDRPWELPMPSIFVIAAIVCGVLASTVLASILYFRLVARAGASNAMLATFTSPAVAILLGVAILGESVQRKHVIGMMLIALGLAAIDGRLFAAFRRPRLEASA